MGGPRVAHPDVEGASSYQDTGHTYALILTKTRSLGAVLEGSVGLGRSGRLGLLRAILWDRMLLQAPIPGCYLP